MYMIRLTNLIKEIGIDGFFNDKIALSFPSVIAKDIKKSLQNINLWQFAWKEANFDDRSSTYKKYNTGSGGGDANDIIAIKNIDFEQAVSAIKNSKMQDRFKSFVVKQPWPKILQYGRFSKFLKDTNSYDKYKTNIDNINWFKSNDITADIWNKNKQKEFSSLKVEGAYYHVSANDKLKPGDIIKPYFDSKHYIKTMLGGSSMGGKIEFAARIIEDVLDENRPASAPSRDKTTYVFKTIDDAVEYLHGGNRSIYAVKPKGQVYFVDMSLIDEMNYEINSHIEVMDMMDNKKQQKDLEREFKSTLNNLAKQYWAKKASTNPVWEGLTKQDIEVIRKVK